MFDFADLRLIPRDGEYRGPDGMLYCARCRQPLTVPPSPLLHFSVRQPYVRVICACRQAALDASNANVLRPPSEPAADLLPPLPRRYADARFADSNMDGAGIRRVYAYAEDWASVSAAGTCLILFGAPGTGKTHAAACLINELSAQHRTAVMTNMRDFQRRIASLPIGDVEAAMAQYRRADLLVLDDLGVEQHSDYTLGLMYDLVNDRYSTKRPIAVTTNVSPEDLRAVSDTRLAQILGRLFQDCVMIRFCTNFRSQTSAGRG